MDHEPDDVIEDSWSRGEYPVLRALARWEQDKEVRTSLTRADVVALVQVDAAEAWKVGRALDRLADDGLISVNRTMDGTPWPSYVRGLTTNGLRRAGVWPSAASFQTDLVERLTKAAERISLDEPAKAGRLRQAAEILADKGTDVLAKVIAEMAAKAAGL